MYLPNRIEHYVNSVMASQSTENLTGLEMLVQVSTKGVIKCLLYLIF